jgi:hypothetical protein
MSAQAPSLITRIRRRTIAMRWLLAILVLAKLTFATSCLAETLSTPPAVLVAALDIDDVAASRPVDEDGALCWHAGLVGCHCCCVHVSAVAPLDWYIVATASPSIAVPFVGSAIRVALRDDHLRPPIG